MKKLLFRFLIVASFFCLMFLGMVLFYPEPTSFTAQQESSKIYDRNGELLYEILIPEKGKQDFILLENISPYLIDSIIAIEDQDFYEHHGIDFSSLVRAFWQNVYYGEVISGASTIEQQLARNLLNHQERTYFNKLKEITLSIKFNLKYDKDEILEKYLNTVYFGNLAYGIETASQTYFGKTASKLDLAESSYLAGLPQAPSNFSPYTDLPAGEKRQTQVLNALLKQKKISQEKFEIASDEELKFQKQKLVNIKAPHFVMWILDELRKEGLLEKIAEGGYSITTTLDLSLQEEIQNLANLHLKQLTLKNITNASVVVLDQETSEVLVMLGSKDYFDAEIDGEVNVALSLRQPGSTLKPFLYALAFEKELNPESTILDEFVQFDSVDGHSYEPKNYDLKYHGEVTLREALAQSLNIPAVKMLDYIGANVFLNKLNELGMTTLNKPSEYYGLALALGSGEVTLFDLTGAYAVLANEGGQVSIQGIKEVTSNNIEDLGSRFWTSQKDVINKGNLILDKNAVQQVTSILIDNYARTPAFGEDSPLNFNYPVAVKTGTSRNFRDNWTLGYTPLRTVGVWVGNSDGSPMINSSGITGAGPLFHSVMEFVMQELPKENFEVGSGELRIESFEDVLKNKKNSDGNAEEKQMLISYPFDGDVFQITSTIPLEKQVLTFKAKTEGEWFLNETLLGYGANQDWEMAVGEHELKLKTEDEEEVVTFFVQ